MGEFVMVTCRVSVTSTVPSFTVRVTVTVVLDATLGAVNVVDSAAGSANVIARVPSWVHEYVGGTHSGRQGYLVKIIRTISLQLCIDTF